MSILCKQKKTSKDRVILAVVKFGDQSMAGADQHKIIIIKKRLPYLKVISFSKFLAVSSINSMKEVKV